MGFWDSIIQWGIPILGIGLILVCGGLAIYYYMMWKKSQEEHYEYTDLYEKTMETAMTNCPDNLYQSKLLMGAHPVFGSTEVGKIFGYTSLRNDWIHNKLTSINSDISTLESHYDSTSQVYKSNLKILEQMLEHYSTLKSKKGEIQAVFFLPRDLYSYENKLGAKIIDHLECLLFTKEQVIGGFESVANTGELLINSSTTETFGSKFRFANQYSSLTQTDMILLFEPKYASQLTADVLQRLGFLVGSALDANVSALIQQAQGTPMSPIVTQNSANQAGFHNIEPNDTMNNSAYMTTHQNPIPIQNQQQ